MPTQSQASVPPAPAVIRNLQEGRSSYFPLKEDSTDLRSREGWREDNVDMDSSNISRTSEEREELGEEVSEAISRTEGWGGEVRGNR